MRHATLADGQYQCCCELSSGNGPFGGAKRTSPVIGACLKHYGCACVYWLAGWGVDLRAHELWDIILVVVIVVLVMALFLGDDGGVGRWRA